MTGPTTDQTLVGIARRRAAETPDRVAYRFLADGEAEEAHLTYAELDRRARGLAVLMQTKADPGDRVLLLQPPGLDYVVGFLACLYAGMVAVPAYPPRTRGRGIERLAAIVEDAGATLALAPRSVSDNVHGRPGAEEPLVRLRWLAPTDANPDEALLWSPPASPDLAFLQYTSGSTGDPKGVMVSHANLAANLAVTRDAFGNTPESVGVSWLPPYHDMGLVGGLLQPLFVGFEVVLMPPAAFLQRPARWLRAMSRYRATVSGAPNFGYDLCAERGAPEEPGALDLSRWRVAFNGAEPVRAGTLDRFVEAFGPHGFRREAFYPCYGLAESTLLATGGAPDAPPSVAAVADGTGPERAVVGCGWPRPGHELRVVDPETHRPCADGQTGEVWLAGPSVARGYWRHPLETEETFGGRLADGTGPYLRTGDLGFLRGGELYVAGRSKDLLIVHGRNLHPSDLEETAGASHPALRRHGAAAFALNVGDGDRLAIVQEVDREALRGLEPGAALAAIRAAVWAEHGIAPALVALVKPGGIPVTSSGKVRRTACREALLTESLPLVARWSVDDTPTPVAVAPPPDEAVAAIEAALRDHVAGLLGLPADQVDPERPLGDYGVTSLQIVEFQVHVADRYGVDLEMELFVEDPSVRRLAAHVHRGKALRPERLDLAAEVQLDPTIHRRGAPTGTRGTEALLTGATGFLGAYLLRELLAADAGPVHCLVRAQNGAAAGARIAANMRRYGLWDEAMASLIRPVVGDLTQPRLGLDQARFAELADRVDAVYHNGAWLNFVYGYPLLKAANVLGTQEALRLAARGRPKLFHYVSTTGVFDSAGYAGQTVDEATPLDRSGGMVLGYSQTKWVAERLVTLAGQRGLPVAIYRPSWILGDSQTGVCNEDDFICRLIDACVRLGEVPDLDYVWNIVAVDYVARAIVRLAGRPESVGRIHHLSSARPLDWTEVVDWLRSAGYPVRVVSYADWRARLLDREGRPPTALDPLLPLFQAQGPGGISIPQFYERSRMPTIDCRATVDALGDEVQQRPLDRELFGRHLTRLALPVAV